MLDLLEEQLDLKINFDLVEGTTAEDLYDFGEKIHNGSVHLGVIWGLEYGWLRKKYGQLEPFVVCAQHGAPYRSQFMVRVESEARNLADLRGKRLAMYPDLSLVDRVYVHELLRQKEHTPDSYFHVLRCESSRQAIFAVNKGRADCVLVNVVSFARYGANRPGIKLRDVEASSEFPEVVLVGSRDAMKKLRVGLWEDLRDALRVIHETAEGEQCVDFWRTERFELSGDRFERLVRERLRDYPIRVLHQLDGAPSP